jgi:hypothetical protein
VYNICGAKERLETNIMYQRLQKNVKSGHDIGKRNRVAASL